MPSISSPVSEFPIAVNPHSNTTPPFSLSGIGTKISRALTRETKGDVPSSVNNGSPTKHERSISRGREILFGRGGLGNIRPSSETRNAESEQKEHSVPRGRGIARTVLGEGGELEENYHDGLLHSTGRGGVANITSIRSPSVESPHPHDRVGPETELGSTGRGGAGNIRSRSRSQARTAVESHPHPPTSNVISTGRGGVGNIRSRSQSQVRTDEAKPHSPAPHNRNGTIDEHGSDVTATDHKPHKHGLDDFLHRVIHPGEHKG